MDDPRSGDDAGAALSEAARERLRAEERLRLDIRAALAPPAPARSGFDRLIALLNTNVGIGTVAALLLSVATWCYTTVDEHLHQVERQAARDSAKALVDVQQVSPFLPLLAKPDSPERALACRILAHMIASGSIDKTLGAGLASEAGNCLAEQARKQAAGGGEALASSSEAIRAVDRRLPGLVGASASDAARAGEINPAQAALARALPRRVYIQYADDGQVDQVKALRTFYQGKGWLVPAAERVGAKAPQRLQVRYFDEADRAAAEQTQRDLATLPALAGVPQAERAEHVKLNAPPGQLEVWLPRY